MPVEQARNPPSMPQQKPLSLAQIVELKQANLNQRIAMLDTLRKLEMEDAQLTQAMINLGVRPPNRAERRREEKKTKKK